jgi:tRNA (guanine-N7-)-methyltransferase
MVPAKDKPGTPQRAGDPVQGMGRLYGRRHGHRLRSHQSDLMTNWLPELEIPLPETPRSLNPKTHFKDQAADQVWLEIGFGGGEHLAAQASAHGDIAFIGCEFYINGIASLLSQMEERALTNIRLHTVDARKFLASLRAQSIDKAFLLYPDPWPKSRHNKRRFVSDWSLDQLAEVLKPGGEFQVATDIPDYCRWTLDHIRRHAAFEWTATGPEDWRRPPVGWLGTRYEAKALREGRTPMYLSFRRK